MKPILLLSCILFAGYANNATVPTNKTYKSCTVSCKQKHLLKRGYQKTRSHQSCVKRCEKHKQKN